MPTEILEPTVATAESSPGGQMEIREIYNDLINLESSLKYSIGTIRRVDIGKEHWELDDSTAKTKHKIEYKLENGLLEENYETISRAAALGEDDVSEIDMLSPLTSERLAFDLLTLSRVYRTAHMQGDHTIYQRHSLKIPVRTKSNSWGEVTQVPWDAQREPLPITQKDVLHMQDAPEEERIALICEALDPYRYRHDEDTDPKDRELELQEQEAVLELLDGLSASWQKDLLATSAFKHFLHKNINRPDLAERALDMVSTPRLRQILVEGYMYAQNFQPESIVESVKETSPDVLERLLKSRSEEEKERLKQRALEQAGEFTVTINADLEVIEKMLFDTNRLLPVSETARSGGNSDEIGQGRLAAEDELGIHPRDDAFLERPIYGAMAVSEDEKILGARNADRYGKCVITLKHDVAESRTIYTYGDTMNLRKLESAGRKGDPDRRMTMAEAAVAKLYYDQEHPVPEGAGIHHDYIEAQILGGVSIEDIESITIPFAQTQRHQGILRVIRHRFPSIDLCLSLTSEEEAGLQETSRQFLERLGVKRVVSGASTK